MVAPVLAAWMVGAVHFFQVFSVNMRIDLRRGYVDVAEHFLDCAQVGPSFEEVRRERMAEGMRVNLFFDTGFCRARTDDIPDRHAAQTSPAGIEKQCIASSFFPDKVRSHFVDILRNPFE